MSNRTYRSTEAYGVELDVPRIVRETIDPHADFDSGGKLHASTGHTFVRSQSGVLSEKVWKFSRPDAPGGFRPVKEFIAEVYRLDTLDALEDFADALAAKHAADPVPQSRAEVLATLHNPTGFARKVAPDHWRDLHLDAERRTFTRLGHHDAIPTAGDMIDLLAAMRPDATMIDLLREAAAIAKDTNRSTPDPAPAAQGLDDDARAAAFRPR